MKSRLEELMDANSRLKEENTQLLDETDREKENQAELVKADNELEAQLEVARVANSLMMAENEVLLSSNRQFVEAHGQLAAQEQEARSKIEQLSSLNVELLDKCEGEDKRKKMLDQFLDSVVDMEKRLVEAEAAKVQLKETLAANITLKEANMHLLTASNRDKAIISDLENTNRQLKSQLKSAAAASPARSDHSHSSTEECSEATVHQLKKSILAINKLKEENARLLAASAGGRARNSELVKANKELRSQLWSATANNSVLKEANTRLHAVSNGDKEQISELEKARKELSAQLKEATTANPASEDNLAHSSTKEERAISAKLVQMAIELESQSNVWVEWIDTLFNKNAELSDRRAEEKKRGKQLMETVGGMEKTCSELERRLQLAEEAATLHRVEMGKLAAEKEAAVRHCRGMEALLAKKKLKSQPVITKEVQSGTDDIKVVVENISYIYLQSQ